MTAKRLSLRMIRLREDSSSTKSRRNHPRKLQLRKKLKRILRLNQLPKRSRKMKIKRNLALLSLELAQVTKSTAPP
jgi:hypothetical protein